MKPYLKKTHHKQKRAGGVAQGIGLDFKPQYRKKKKKRILTTKVTEDMEKKELSCTLGGNVNLFSH
jgi:hypothetical protein